MKGVFALLLLSASAVAFSPSGLRQMVRSTNKIAMSAKPENTGVKEESPLVDRVRSSREESRE